MSKNETEHVYYENDDHETISLGNDTEQRSLGRSRNEDGMREGGRGRSQESRSMESKINNKHRRGSQDRAVGGNSQDRNRHVSKSRSSDNAGSSSHYDQSEKKTSSSRGGENLSNEELPLGCTLYVRNLPTHFSTEEVRAYFNKYGEVVDCRMVINPVTKESRGFGFVTYRALEIADNVMAQLDQSEMEGRTLRVEKARRNRPHDPTPGEYKGASIKYDTRGRLKPGYVPYWDLPPPRAMDRDHVTSGKHHRDYDYYHHHHHRSRSNPRYQRHPYDRDGAHRARSPSHYHNGSCGGNQEDYYYSPSGAREHVSSSMKDARCYYDYPRRRYNDDYHHRSSAYRAAGGSNHNVSVSPRRAQVPHWEARRHYHNSPISNTVHRRMYTSSDRQHHDAADPRVQRGGHTTSSRSGNYYSGEGGNENADCSIHMSRRRSTSRPRGENVSSSRASPGAESGTQMRGSSPQHISSSYYSRSARR